MQGLRKIGILDSCLDQDRVRHSYTQRQGRILNPSRLLTAEQKGIKKNCGEEAVMYCGKKGEQQSRDSRRNRKKKRISKSNREHENITKTGRSWTEYEQLSQPPDEIEPEPETRQNEEVETMSPDSEHTIAVPKINFNRHLGTSGIRYMHSGKAGF